MSTFQLQTGLPKPATVNNDFWAFTPFQIKFMQDLQEQPSFDYYVAGEWAAVGKPRNPGWFNVLWFENNVLHSQRVGQKRILGAVITAN